MVQETKDIGILPILERRWRSSFGIDSELGNIAN